MGYRTLFRSTLPSWSDSFLGTGGYWEGREGWNAATYNMTTGVDRSTAVTVRLDQTQLSSDTYQGQVLFNLATYTPSSSDYYAQVSAQVDTDTGVVYGPFVRGSYGVVTANSFTGYNMYVGAGTDQLVIYRRDEGAADLSVGAVTVTGFDPMAMNVLKLEVSTAVGDVVLKAYVNGALKLMAVDDSAEKILTVGRTGFGMVKQTGQSAYSRLFSVVG